MIIYRMLNTDERHGKVERIKDQVQVGQRRLLGSFLKETIQVVTFPQVRQSYKYGDVLWLIFRAITVDG